MSKTKKRPQKNPNNKTERLNEKFLKAVLALLIHFNPDPAR